MCIGDSPDYSSAAQIQAQAAMQAAQLQLQMYYQARKDVAPWRTGGQAAETQIGGLLGLPGYTAIDPTKTLQSTPGYQWALDQGIGAMDRSAAAKGLLLSGPQRNATQAFGQGLALNNAWAPYMSALTGMSGRGLQAGGMSGQWGMQTGQQVGQDYMAAANAQAQAMIQQQNAQNASTGGWMQGLGMLGSLALAPFTGGTSLVGMGAGALGNLFGGAGGGGGSGMGGYNPYAGYNAVGGFGIPSLVM